MGDRVTIKNAVLIWDRVTIEDDVFLGPNMVFTNDLVPRVRFKTPPEGFLPTRVEVGASIGAQATVVCGVTIGRHALVGAGSLVRADVPPHALVVGNPARQVGWVCECGGRLESDGVCSRRCGRRYDFVAAAPKV